MKFESLRGFRDYLPPDAGVRARLFATLRQVAIRSGFEEIETPSLESLELLKAKSGEAIVEETFAFTDKGGREVTLIPENTPSVARLLVERAKSIPLPVKWFAIPKLWRYEEPQAGRLREFSQVSLDIFGAKGVDADIEILATTRAMLDALGLSGRYLFRVSDRRLGEGVARAFGVQDPAVFFRALDRSKKISDKEFTGEIERSGVSADRAGPLVRLVQQTASGKEALRALDRMGELPGLGEEGKEGIANLKALFTRGIAAGLSDLLVLDLAVVRGLAYYTSTVFEAYDTGQSLRALFGGGRYDKLVELFGGPPTPACGVAMGDQTLELLMRESGLWPERGLPLDVYVACAGDHLRPEGITWTERLRSKGFSTERDLLERSLSAQMKEAARKEAGVLLLIAPEERAQGQVVVRNMQTGQQAAFSDADAEPEIRRVLRERSPPPSAGA